MIKRGFNTRQAQEYLGVPRRFFETHLLPMLRHKGVRAGTSIIYEKEDLDHAWDCYKLSHGSERVSQGDMTWRHVQEGNKVSPRIRPVGGRSTRNTEENEFESVVSRITGRRKTS